MEFKRRIKIMETEIIKINPKDIKLLKLNARYMKPQEYQKLVANIKKDGQLTSVPFCYYNEKNEIEVLSGNHRVMASIDAGLNEIEIMICKNNLTKEQALAIQLSHNSICGQDLPFCQIFYYIERLEIIRRLKWLELKQKFENPTYDKSFKSR